MGWSTIKDLKMYQHVGADILRYNMYTQLIGDIEKISCMVVWIEISYGALGKCK